MNQSKQVPKISCFKCKSVQQKKNYNKLDKNPKMICLMREKTQRSKIYFKLKNRTTRVVKKQRLKRKPRNLPSQRLNLSLHRRERRLMIRNSFSEMSNLRRESYHAKRKKSFSTIRITSPEIIKISMRLIKWKTKLMSKYLIRLVLPHLQKIKMLLTDLL